MFEKYHWIEQRYLELSDSIVQPEVAADPALYQRLLREKNTLEEAFQSWQTYKQLKRLIADTEDLLEDPELGREAQAELDRLRADVSSMEEKLKILLLPRDPDDDRNVVIEIRAGAGGEEAALFGRILQRMYVRYADRKGFRVETISESATELGGVKECVFTVTGKGAFSRLKYESGVHRIQRVPVTESNGKIQTSTCTVAILPEAETVDVTIDPGDLRIDVYRSTGHGGQCVNTTDSAVRVTHLPTGIVVTCQDQKSQLKNRDQALRVLRTRLLMKLRAERDAAYAENRRSQVGSGDRSERIRSYNFREGRLTDHRIGLTLYKLQEFTDGDLDEVINALKTEEQAEQLKQLSAE